ncbi:MAG: hypothetical protein Q9174_004636 [Haloplaca sp. 1 TL-2023]
MGRGVDISPHGIEDTFDQRFPPINSLTQLYGAPSVFSDAHKVHGEVGKPIDSHDRSSPLGYNPDASADQSLFYRILMDPQKEPPQQPDLRPSYQILKFPGPKMTRTRRRRFFSEAEKEHIQKNDDTRSSNTLSEAADPSASDIFDKGLSMRTLNDGAHDNNILTEAIAPAIPEGEKFASGKHSSAISVNDDTRDSNTLSKVADPAIPESEKFTTGRDPRVRPSNHATRDQITNLDRILTADHEMWLNRDPNTVIANLSKRMHPKLMCPHCDRYPNGFRGDFELERHVARIHAQIRIHYQCRKSNETGEEVPGFDRCNACRTGKKFNAHYNAAAHLRRVHFNPKPKAGELFGKEKTKDRSFGEWPPMDDLRHFMTMISEDVRDHAKEDVREDVSGDGEEIPNSLLHAKDFSGPFDQ